MPASNARKRKRATAAAAKAAADAEAAAPALVAAAAAPLVSSTVASVAAAAPSAVASPAAAGPSAKKKKGGKKKQRWRNRHQAMVNQLPYNAAPNDVRKFFGQVVEDAAIADVAMVRVTADNYGRAASVSTQDAQLKRRFCGQAFVTFATADDLEKALTLHRSTFQQFDTMAAEKVDRQLKTTRNPVNVVVALTQRELKRANKQASATSTSTGALPQRTLRTEEDVAQDVLFTITNPASAGADGLAPGLVLGDERLKHLLMTMPEDAARSALAEFHNISSGKVSKSAAGYLHGICNKWKRGDGGLDEQQEAERGGWAHSTTRREARDDSGWGVGAGGGGRPVDADAAAKFGGGKRKGKNRRLGKGRKARSYA